MWFLPPWRPLELWRLPRPVHGSWEERWPHGDKKGVQIWIMQDQVGQLDENQDTNPNGSQILFHQVVLISEVITILLKHIFADMAILRPDWLVSSPILIK